jgi:hypothetical protein
MDIFISWGFFYNMHFKMTNTSENILNVSKKEKSREFK